MVTKLDADSMMHCDFSSWVTLTSETWTQTPEVLKFLRRFQSTHYFGWVHHKLPYLKCSCGIITRYSTWHDCVLHSQAVLKMLLKIPWHPSKLNASRVARNTKCFTWSCSRHGPFLYPPHLLTNRTFPVTFPVTFPPPDLGRRCRRSRSLLWPRTTNNDVNHKTAALMGYPVRRILQTQPPTTNNHNHDSKGVYNANVQQYRL